jgi:membrane-bound lytic murein transglycosylase A
MIARAGARHAGRPWRAALFALSLAVASAHAAARAENSEVQGLPAPPGPMRIADTRLEPVAWSDIDGWTNDDHGAAFTTFLASCRPIVAAGKSRYGQRDARPVAAGLLAVCQRALAAGALKGEAVRRFFEDNFRPVRISKLDAETGLGLLTGYYEPIVDGSRFPTRDFHIPLYRRPPDLTYMGVKRRGSMPNRGRVMRRINWRTFVPYHDRAAIEDGALAGRHLEICYLRSWTDVLFMQIQGSARIRLEDGLVVRVNYSGHNGQPSTSVGRTLLDRNLVSRDQMSMDAIRVWMEKNPTEAAEVRRLNKSFSFFRILGLSDGGEGPEAQGAQGIPLTPERSIAVDRFIHVYGTPFFIESSLPIASDAPTTKFRRLMIAQDTGGAILGPARADLFFGAGDEAGRIAGRIKQQGRFTMLLPRELDLVEAGKAMPLPVDRPPGEILEYLPPTPPLAGPVPLPRPRPKT